MGTSSNGELGGPVCLIPGYVYLLETLLFIEPPFTGCFNSLNFSGFYFLELCFSKFQKIWQWVHGPPRLTGSRSPGVGSRDLHLSLISYLFLPLATPSLSTPSSLCPPSLPPSPHVSLSLSLFLSHEHMHALSIKRTRPAGRGSQLSVSVPNSANSCDICCQ